jgi:plastocyanin
MRKPVLNALFAILSAGLSAAVVAQQHVISQKGKQFSPMALTVKVGESVNFKNDDNVYHNVFSLSKVLSFDLGAMPPGQSRKVEMVKEGVIDVECAIHPDMKLQIKVVK